MNLLETPFLVSLRIKCITVVSICNIVREKFQIVSMTKILSDLWNLYWLWKLLIWLKAWHVWVVRRTDYNHLPFCYCSILLLTSSICISVAMLFDIRIFPNSKNSCFVSELSIVKKKKKVKMYEGHKVKLPN